METTMQMTVSDFFKIHFPVRLPFPGSAVGLIGVSFWGTP